MPVRFNSCQKHQQVDTVISPLVKYLVSYYIWYQVYNKYNSNIEQLYTRYTIGIEKAPAVNPTKSELAQAWALLGTVSPVNFLIYREKTSLTFLRPNFLTSGALCIRVYIRVQRTKDENKTKYDMHDGYDKIPTWLDLVVNKKRMLQMLEQQAKQLL